MNKTENKQTLLRGFMIDFQELLLFICGFITNNKIVLAISSPILLRTPLKFVSGFHQTLGYYCFYVREQQLKISASL
jgi:hypothetical protein